MSTQVRFELRRGTYAQWTAQSAQILLPGEPGWDTTNKILRIGDGVTPWLGLTIVNPTLSSPPPTAGNTGSIVLYSPGASGTNYSSALSVGPSSVVVVDALNGNTGTYQTSNPTLYLSGDMLPTQWPANLAGVTGGGYPPSAPGAPGFTIGSLDRPIRGIYLSDGTLYVGGAIIESTSQGTFATSSINSQPGTSFPGIAVSENFMIALGTGDSGQFPVQWSADGISWTPVETLSNTAGADLTAISWCGTTWVIGGKNKFFRSPSGFYWEQAVFTGPGGFFSESTQAIACLNGITIAVGDDGATPFPPGTSRSMIISTDDDRTWTRGTSGASISGVGFDIGTDGVNTWVAGGDGDTNLIYSLDGVNWEVCQGDSLDIVGCMTFGAGKWLAAGENSGGPKVITSTDGITWAYSDNTINGTDPNFSAFTIAYNGVRWMIVGAPGTSGNNFMYTSTNGFDWSPVTGITKQTLPSPTSVVRTVSWNGSQWVAAGLFPTYLPPGSSTPIAAPFSFLTSIDGINWFTTDGLQYGVNGQVNAIFSRHTLPYSEISSGYGGAGGSAGPTGATGRDGSAGPTGATGRDGADGADGAAGPTGATGRDGAAGPTGPTGPAPSYSQPVTGTAQATAESFTITGTAITLMTAPIPFAGTWQITAQVNCDLVNGQLCVYGLFDGTDTLVANSEATAGYIGLATWRGQGTSTYTVTTVGAEDYTIRAWGPGAITGCIVKSNTFGRTFVTWTQLTGGYVGATGATGRDGTAGPTGATGRDGADGSAGPTGATGSSFKTSTNLSLSVEPVEGSGPIEITVDQGLSYIAGNSVVLQNEAQDGFEGIIASYNSLSGNMQISQITNVQGTLVESTNPFNVNLTGKRGTKIFYGTGAPTINARSGDIYIDTNTGQLYTVQ